MRAGVGSSGTLVDMAKYCKARDPSIACYCVEPERLLAGSHPTASIAVVLADSGMKYLSTDLWNETGQT